MKRRVTLLGTIAVVALTAAIAAQAKPNFAGKWTLVADPNAPAGRGGFGGLGQEFTSVQDEKTLTVTSTTQMGEMKQVYNLDGTETKNPLNFNGNSIDRVSKVKWDGNKLVITTTTEFNGNTNESTQTWALETSGNLTIESTFNFGDNGPTTTKSTYKKS